MRPDSVLPDDVRQMLARWPRGPRIARRLIVSLGQEDHPVGELHHHASQAAVCSSFRYLPSWLNHPEFFAVSPDLCPTCSPQWCRPSRGKTRSVFGAMADTQPQGFGQRVIQRTQERGFLDAFRQDGDEPGPMDALCTVPDMLRAGALRIRPVGEPAPDLERQRYLVPWHSGLTHFGQAIRAFERREEDHPHQLLLLHYGATALGGHRPKCSWLDEDGKLCVAKFPSLLDTFPMTRLETLIAQIARFGGIEGLHLRLKHPLNEPVVLMERFDRGYKGMRIPYLSAHSLLQSEPGDALSYFDLLDAMRGLCIDYPGDARELWRRLVFSLLINHNDADLRKVGFLYVGQGRWRLGPAFGLIPSLDPPTPASVAHSSAPTPVGSLKTLLQAAFAFEVAPKEALDILRRLLNAIVHWQARAREFSVGMSRAEIDRLEPVLDNLHTRLGRELLRG